MERKAFLKGISLASMSAIMPFERVFSQSKSGIDKTTSCTLIPTETEGPFPLDLTANTYYFRQDLREDRTGVTLHLKLKILGSENCAPMANARVNVWMCDKDGVYSGYASAQNPGGQANTTWLRGYQMTDASGEVDFTTIFPGWYQGRICHIHFRVFVSSNYAVVSQLSFDINTKNALYAQNSSLYTKGNDPMTFQQDNIFSDGYTYQLASLTPNSDGSYSSFLEVSVQGSGDTTSVGHIEKENAKNFVLGQNYPNPYQGATTIPFSLKTASKVQLGVYDLSGRRIAYFDQGRLQVGDYNIVFNVDDYNVGSANYVYQIEVSNENGIFKAYKLMTALK